MKRYFNYILIIIIIIISSSIYNVNASCPSGSESSSPIEYKFLVIGDSINNEMPIVGWLNGSACLIITKNNNVNVETYYFQSGTTTELSITSINGVKFSGQAVYYDDRYSVLSYKFPSAVLTQDSNSLITLTITNGKIWLRLPNNVNR